MKFDIYKTLLLAVVILGAGCGNLTEPSSFSFTTLTGVPLNTTVQSNVVTIKGNQFGASIAFVGMSSAQYSEYSINGGAFTTTPPSNGLVPGDTLQLEQITSSNLNTPRTTTINVGGFITTFTTVTSSTGGTVSATDTCGNKVTISNLTPALTSNNGAVDFTITGVSTWSYTPPASPPANCVSPTSASQINATFILQPKLNTNNVIPATTEINVPISYGEQSGTLLTPVPGVLYSGSGTLPGGLPYYINNNAISTTAYWYSLISYWQIVPESLTIQ